MKPVVAGLNRKAWGVFLLLAAIGAAGGSDRIFRPRPWQWGRSPCGFSSSSSGTWSFFTVCGRPWHAPDFSPSSMAGRGLALRRARSDDLDRRRMGAGRERNIRPAHLRQRADAAHCHHSATSFSGALVLTRSQAVASLLDTTPPHWLVGLQVYRILGAIFIVYWIHGEMPGRLRTARRNWRRRHGPARTAGGGLGCHRFPGRKEDRHPLEPLRPDRLRRRRHPRNAHLTRPGPSPGPRPSQHPDRHVPRRHHSRFRRPVFDPPAPAFTYASSNAWKRQPQLRE